MFNVKKLKEIILVEWIWGRDLANSVMYIMLHYMLSFEKLLGKFLPQDLKFFDPSGQKSFLSHRLQIATLSIVF